MPLFNPNYDSSYWRSKEFDELEPQDLSQLTSFLNTFVYVPSTEEDLLFHMDLDDESVEDTEYLSKTATPQELKEAFFEPLVYDLQKTGLQSLLSKFSTSSILTENLDLIYDEIIHPVLFENQLSFEDIVTIVNQQFIIDIDEEIASYLLRKICANMVSFLRLDEEKLKQFIHLAPTEIFTKHFLETILQKSGLFEIFLQKFKMNTKKANQFTDEEIENLYCKNFFRTIFLPLAGQLTLSEKLQVCQQWFDINLVQSRKQYYLPKLLAEILLPSFEKNQGLLSQISWQKISGTFIDAILVETQNDSLLLRKEILQALLEKNPEKLLGLSLILAEDIFPLLLNKKNFEIFPWNSVSDQFIFSIIVFITKQPENHNDLKENILQKIFKRKPGFYRKHQKQLLDLPYFREEIVLPVFQLDKKNIDRVAWNKVSNEFIDHILHAISHASKYEDLKSEILQKLIEHRIEYFLKKPELFLQFRETLLKLSAYFVLKNFSSILSFINIEGLKEFASIFEPYDRLMAIPWQEISDETIDAILSYAKDTKNEDFEIAVLKGVYQHNIEYFKKSNDYEELYRLFSSLTAENKNVVALEIFNWVNIGTSMGWYSSKVNVEILNQLLARIDFNTFIKAIPQETLSYYLTVFLASPPEIIAENLAAMVGRITENTNVEEKKEQLSQLLILSSSENSTVKTEIARVEGLLKVLSNPPPEFLNGVQGYFQSVIYSFEYNQITLLEFRDTLHSIIEICKSEPDQAYAFLEMLGESVTQENFFSQIEANECYEVLANLTNIALAHSLASSQDTLALKIVNEFISCSDIFKKNLHNPFEKVLESQNSISSNSVAQEIDKQSSLSESSHVELINKAFELQLEAMISSNEEDRISPFLQFWKNLMSEFHISKKQAQDLLKIFHQQFSFLNHKPKQTARMYSSALFASEAKEIKNTQKEIKESIKGKNKRIESTLKKFSKNKEFCKLLAILVNTADNAFGEEKNCSDESLFQRFYPNTNFQQCLVGPIQNSFNSALKQHKNSSPSYLSQNFGGFGRRKSPPPQSSSGEKEQARTTITGKVSLP
jgi:hypothetical protein